MLYTPLMDHVVLFVQVRNQVSKILNFICIYSWPSLKISQFSILIFELIYKEQQRHVLLCSYHGTAIMTMHELHFQPRVNGFVLIWLDIKTVYQSPFNNLFRKCKKSLKTPMFILPFVQEISKSFETLMVIHPLFRDFQCLSTKNYSTPMYRQCQLIRDTNVFYH